MLRPTRNGRAAPLCGRRIQRTATAKNLRARAQPFARCLQSQAQNLRRFAPAPHSAAVDRPLLLKYERRLAHRAPPVLDAIHMDAGNVRLFPMHESGPPFQTFSPA